VRNGKVFEGIYHGSCTEPDLGVCIKMAKAKMEGSKVNTNPLIENLIIMPKDLVAITALNLDISTLKEKQNEGNF